MNAVLTWRIGHDFAKKIFDQYECKNPNDDVRDTNMDVYNNSVGRGIGMQAGSQQFPAAWIELEAGTRDASGVRFAILPMPHAFRNRARSRHGNQPPNGQVSNDKTTRAEPNSN